MHEQHLRTLSENIIVPLNFHEQNVYKIEPSYLGRYKLRPSRDAYQQRSSDRCNDHRPLIITHVQCKNILHFFKYRQEYLIISSFVLQ